jgi:ribosome assembly protein YihI (activator of Der GTPase)
LSEANNAATVASSKVTSLQQSVTQLNQEFEKDKTKNVQAAYTKLRTEAGKLGVDLTNIPIDYTEQNLLELNNAMNKLAADGIAQVDQGLDTIEVNMESTGAAADNLGSKMTGAASDVNKLDA